MPTADNKYLSPYNFTLHECIYSTQKFAFALTVPSFVMFLNVFLQGFLLTL